MSSEAPNTPIHSHSDPFRILFLVHGLRICLEPGIILEPISPPGWHVRITIQSRLQRIQSLIVCKCIIQLLLELHLLCLVVFFSRLWAVIIITRCPLPRPRAFVRGRFGTPVFTAPFSSSGFFLTEAVCRFLFCRPLKMQFGHSNGDTVEEINSVTSDKT